MASCVCAAIVLRVELSPAASFDPANNCHSAFGNSSFEEKVQRFAELQLEIERRKANSRSSNSKALEQAYREKKAEIIVHLKALGYQKEELEDWLRAAIQGVRIGRSNESLRSEEKRRDQDHELFSEMDGRTLHFAKVTPGEFIASVNNPDPSRIDSLESFPMKVDHVYELGKTEVSVRIWKAIIDAAVPLDPRFAELKEARMQSKEDAPARPIQRTPYFIQLWIEALNRLAETDAPLIHTILPGHKRGDTYRLPSEAEWALVANRRSNALKAAQQLWPNIHAAAGLDSGGALHTSVVSAAPFVFEGNEYSFIYGNYQLVSDKGSDISRTNLSYQVGAEGGQLIVGSIVKVDGKDLRHVRATVSDNQTAGYISFRLVRSTNSK